jgi:hypothetical protein
VPAPLSPRLRLGLAAVLLVGALLRGIFAFHDLDADRFWDEQYSFQNVAAVLIDGRLVPAHALYPSLSYLPHTAVLAVSHGLYRGTGAEVFRIVGDARARTFTPTAYFLVRLLTVGFGVWALWLLFALGRRGLDAESALVATLLLAAFWRHIGASGEYKPDSLVVALGLVALGWSLDALERDTWPAFLLAGVGVGLATSAKYNAALLAVGLVAGVTLRGRDALATLPKLVAAGAASLVVFVALNPWLGLVWEGFRFQVGYYGRVAERKQSDRWQVLTDTLEFFTRHQGWLVVGAALAGLAAVLWLGRREARYRALRPLAAVTLGYPLLYAASTAILQNQNLLPVAPLTCLFAGWALVAAWRGLGRRWPLLARPAAGAAAFALAAALAFRFPVEATYLDRVPATHERAAERLAQVLVPARLRLAYVELDEAKLHARGEHHFLPVLDVEELPSVPAAELALADAELFPAARLAEPGAVAYQFRLERPGTRVERLAARLFRAWGPELVLALHPWQPVGEPLAVALEETAPGRRRASLAGLVAPGEVVSLSLVAHRAGKENPVGKVFLGERHLAVRYTGVEQLPWLHYASQRVVLTPETLELHLEQGPKAATRPPPRVLLYRWRQGEPRGSLLVD